MSFTPPISLPANSCLMAVFDFPATSSAAIACRIASSAVLPLFPAGRSSASSALSAPVSSLPGFSSSVAAVSVRRGVDSGLQCGATAFKFHFLGFEDGDTVVCRFEFR